ncbi:alpha/beta hydrolase [Pusillimonas sp. MFBS29]|uniref:alpha/beta hydrolase n=1 Tax=Pusillimonas sp. MFBS29 TaxID=2886690 RepID=UPI001D11BE7E|nr:alpha/beta hydrolase [Pusillimonas sp. MFBS29]MCC2596760.1 alpha/beta hydrolase [Pusillimonas sp. MFBS29]
MVGRRFDGMDRATLDREYDNVAKIDPDAFKRVLATLEQKSVAARERYEAVLDVPYGSGELERLDIFRTGRQGSRVNVFFHGGYWQMLDKQGFSYVADGLVPHDIASVVVNYPLMPQASMHDLVAACERALCWVLGNIERFGGDPERVSISGHSAGAHLVAMLLAGGVQEPRYELPRLASACAISGIYDLQPIRLSFVNDNLGLTKEAARQFSPVLMDRQVKCPLSVLVGGAEGSEYLRQSVELVQAWRQLPNIPALTVLEGENHFSLRSQLGDASSSVVARLLET